MSGKIDLSDLEVLVKIAHNPTLKLNDYTAKQYEDLKLINVFRRSDPIYTVYELTPEVKKHIENCLKKIINYTKKGSK